MMSDRGLTGPPEARITLLMTRQDMRTRRESLGLKLREVSRRTGINPGRLSIIERGVTPSLEEHQSIEAVLIAAEREAVAS